MGAYLRPETLGEALAALAAGEVTIIAGGTDFYPARVGNPVGNPVDETVLDISGLDALRDLRAGDGAVHIGALTTWSDILRADLPSRLAGLRQAAGEIGGVQIQNVATVCGNICNASPAADGMPALLALDAVVELASASGARTVPLSAFVTGNRRTTRRADELVTGLSVPDPGDDARAVFLKLGARRYLVISIVMVSAVLARGADGAVSAARVAVGACSEVAQRLPALERALLGAPVDGRLGDIVDAVHLQDLAPIDDLRGSTAYRREAARTLVARALSTLAETWS